MKRTNVIPFKNHAGISSQLIERLLRQGKEFGLSAIYPLPTEKIVVGEWVQLKCRYGCNRYNTNWCCPPATPETDRVRAILREYSLALVLVGTQRCVDFYRENNKKRLVQVRSWKGTISLERQLFLEGYYKAFSLVGSCCALCPTCGYPDSCRFPQERRPSVESFSIDVIETLSHLGTMSKVATNVTDDAPHYSMILLE
jgi:predicted metal-binding protein